MTRFAPMPNRSFNDSVIEDQIFERLQRRAWPIAISIIFLILGLLYFFRWASVVSHSPAQWWSAGDLSDSFRASTTLVQGNFGAYSQWVFRGFGGRLLLLAPLAAIKGAFGTTLVQVRDHGHLLAHLVSVKAIGFPFLTTGIVTLGPKQYVVHPQVYLALAPFVLILSSSVLFACDALAERLHVSSTRRALLCVAEAVMLWPVAVTWGHPEDAVALALATYALVLALDGRFTGAGWLFGFAVATQPFVIVMFPILVVMAGRDRALGFVLRSVVPAVAITVPSLAYDFHGGIHAMANQAINSDIPSTHQTPWTFLAPKLGGRGAHATVGSGPLRVVGIGLAVVLGWWSTRWRDRPEMLVWAIALALALRTYTESVLTSYYGWPALAMGLVIASRASTRRFGIAIGVVIATTIVAQWQLDVYTWWLLQVAGISGVLILAIRPEPVEQIKPVTKPVGAGTPRAPAQKRSVQSKKKRKAARTDRKKTAKH